jgi:hypothetical protein
MDIYGWFIANLHQLLGHDKAAAALGQPTGDKTACVLCAYERGTVDRQVVLVALQPRAQCPVLAVPRD